MSAVPIPTSTGCYFNDSDLVQLLEHLLHRFSKALSLFSSFNITQSTSIELLLVGEVSGEQLTNQLTKHPAPTWILHIWPRRKPWKEGEQSWEGVKAEEGMQMKGVLPIKFSLHVELMSSQVNNPKINSKYLVVITELLGHSF